MLWMVFGQTWVGIECTFLAIFHVMYASRKFHSSYIMRWTWISYRCILCMCHRVSLRGNQTPDPWHRSPHSKAISQRQLPLTQGFGQCRHSCYRQTQVMCCLLVVRSAIHEISLLLRMFNLWPHLLHIWQYHACGTGTSTLAFSLHVWSAHIYTVVVYVHVTLTIDKCICI